MVCRLISPYHVKTNKTVPCLVMIIVNCTTINSNGWPLIPSQIVNSYTIVITGTRAGFGGKLFCTSAGTIAAFRQSGILARPSFFGMSSFKLLCVHSVTASNTTVLTVRIHQCSHAVMCIAQTDILLVKSFIHFTTCVVSINSVSIAKANSHLHRI